MTSHELRRVGALIGAVLLTGMAVAIAAAPGSAMTRAITPATTPTATPAPIELGADSSTYPPEIAYDPTTQTTYVAWTNTSDSSVQLCVVPSGAAGCESGAPYALGDAAATGNGTNPDVFNLEGLTVLPSGEVVVVGDVYGGYGSTFNPSGASPSGYSGGSGSIAWTSPAGGAAFASAGQGLENGGMPLTQNGTIYSADNVVSLGSGDFGLIDDTPGGNAQPFSFSDFGLTAASPATNANADPNNTYTDQGSSLNPVAAEPAPAPAASGTEIVIGAADSYDAAKDPNAHCADDSTGGTDSGYGMGVGQVDGTSNAAGTLNNSASWTGYQLLECNAQNPFLTSGPSGIGVVETSGQGGGANPVDYRQFDATATGGTFGAPIMLPGVTATDGTYDLSQDAGTGVYAVFQEGGGSRYEFDYSANGGATWPASGPVDLVEGSPNTDFGHGVIAGIGGGEAEFAFIQNVSGAADVYLQRVAFQTAGTSPTALTTIQTSGSESGPSITVIDGTTTITDQATVTGAHASTATGTVTYRLYSSSSCSTGSQVFSSGPKSVTDGVAQPSGAVVAEHLIQEYSYWQDSYSGDGINAPSQSTCGGETLTVKVPFPVLLHRVTVVGAKATLMAKCSTHASCRIVLSLTSTPKQAHLRRTGTVATAKPLVLAHGTFTIPGKHSKLLTLSLSAAGKRFIAAHGGHLSATLHITQKTTVGALSTTKTVSIVTKGRPR